MIVAGKTKIEWATDQWNPVVGCSVVSSGCKHCYAMKMAGTRLKHTPQYRGLTIDTKEGPVWNGELRILGDDVLTQPLRWKKPRRIFVNSMSDLFHEKLADADIDRVFAVMALCPQHTFLVLTKRAERMRTYMMEPIKSLWAGRAFRDGKSETDAAWRVRQTVTGMLKDILPKTLNAVCDYLDKHMPGDGFSRRWPLPNVLLGFSAEDQENFDARWEHMRPLAAAGWRTWCSAEPLLGPVDAAKALAEGLSWMVVGGESGPGARPMRPEWARGVRDQCKAAGVAFFFKQWGVWLYGKRVGEFNDGRVKFGDGETFEVVSDGHDIVLAAADDHRGEPKHLWRDYWASGDGNLLRWVGKKRAGRLLDGCEHNEFPEDMA